MAGRRSAASLLLFVAVGVLCAGLAAASAESLVPAFLWSDHGLRDAHLPQRSVDYRTLSADELAATAVREVLRPRRRSPAEDEAVAVEVVLAFVGTKLQSGDVSRRSDGAAGTAELLLVLDAALEAANSSVSIPYVRAPVKRGGGGRSLTDALLAKIVEGVGGNLGEVVTAGACDYQSATQTRKVSTVKDLKAYLSGKKKVREAGTTDVVFVCGSSEAESLGSIPISDSDILDGILLDLARSKTAHVALYVTDLAGGPSLRLRRQLGTVVRESEVYCNEVCQAKATLLEGLAVGLTLIVILISGLCCMAGISTPNRFEHPNDAGQ